MSRQQVCDYLFNNVTYPLEERPFHILTDRSKDEVQIQLINARIFLTYSEALSFADAVD